MMAVADGKNLVLVARSAGKLGQIAETIRRNYKTYVIPIVADLSDESGVNTLISEISNQNIQINTLINNAGFGDFGGFAIADLVKSMGMIRLN